MRNLLSQQKDLVVAVVERKRCKQPSLESDEKMFRKKSSKVPTRYPAGEELNLTCEVFVANPPTWLVDVRWYTDSPKSTMVKYHDCIPSKKIKPFKTFLDLHLHKHPRFFGWGRYFYESMHESQRMVKDFTLPNRPVSGNGQMSARERKTKKKNKASGNEWWRCG